MIESIEKVIEELQELQENLEESIEEHRKKFQYELLEKKVIFERSMLAQHKRLKESLGSYIRSAKLTSIVSAPFVYAMIVPFAILDISVSLYQAICFRLWGIPRVQRSNYVVIDRHHLAYLNAIEKLNCVYCGYANGVVAFTRDVAGRTEEHWCPIKHARTTSSAHHHYYNFLEFGDGDGWKNLSESTKKDESR